MFVLNLNIFLEKSEFGQDYGLAKWNFSKGNFAATSIHTYIFVYVYVYVHVYIYTYIYIYIYIYIY